MTENEIKTVLSEDISELKLPPISENVINALHEKNPESALSAEHHVISAKKKNNAVFKFVFAVMLALLAVSAPLIIVLNDISSDTVVSEKGSTVNSETEIPESTNKTIPESSDITSSFESADVLEKIQMQKVYGTVALSGRSEEELETLLEYCVDAKIYEDKQYLYSFDSDGNLLEILNISEKKSNGDNAPEEKILKTSEELFAYYFPELNRDDYEIEYQGEADAMPAWIVEYTRTTEGIIDSKIRMTFDACGELHMIIATENIKEGKISKKQAVEIALNELRSDKYDIPEFDRNDIHIEIAAKNDKSCYTVSVSGIPSNDKYITAYAFFTIDYNNGNIIDSEVIC